MGICDDEDDDENAGKANQKRKRKKLGSKITHKFVTHVMFIRRIEPRGGKKEESMIYDPK